MGGKRSETADIVSPYLLQAGEITGGVKFLLQEGRILPDNANDFHL
jgi:hypothetical protein